MGAGRTPGADSGELARVLADPAQVKHVLKAFLSDDGRLLRFPAKHTRRLVLLDRFAGLFEPGVRYPETEVNAILRSVHDDVASLRRYLVDEGFLDRDAGTYWRIGGTVTDPADPSNPSQPGSPAGTGNLGEEP